MNRVAVTACVALGTAGVLAAAMSPARAEQKSTLATERHLVVTLVTPTVNQEVLPELGDPGLNNVITVKFSAYLNAHDIIDYQNVVNSLSSKVEFLNSAFARLPGTPSVRRNIFTFSPLSATTPSLPQGQYTLNMKSSIRSTRGSLLNEGLADFTTTFSVGTDVYPPVLRKISPVDGQTGINLLQKIVATFNEPIEAASLPGNVTVLDGSTNPPSPVPGLGGTGLTLARGGFDVIFTPDPCFGYPPKTNITFNIQGLTVPATNTAAVTDVFQNKFKRDSGLQWTRDLAITTLYHSPNGVYDELTGVFTMTFQTKGVKPPPAAPPVGSAQMGALYGPIFAPCAAQLWLAPGCNGVGAQELYTTTNGVGVIDLRQYVVRYNQGITTAYDRIAVVPNSPVRMGRPGGVAYDPRFIVTPASQFGHTFMYIVDERAKVVNVVRTDNLKVMGRFTGFADPRDVSVSTNPAANLTTLYVSDFGSNQIIGINLEGIAVTYGAQPGKQSPCEAIKDNQSARASISVGAGPTEVCADGYLHQRIMVTNTLENTISLIDPTVNKMVRSVEVGGNPSCCDWVCIQFGRIRVGLITNQGGLTDPDGSISMYINSPPLNGGFLGAGQLRDGIESTLVDGVKNPAHIWGNLQWIDPPPPAGTLTSVLPEWWASNTGGATAIRLRINIAGLFGLAITPQVINTYPVGLNPIATTLDSLHPNRVLMSAVSGLGSLALTDPDREIQPFLLPVAGMRRLYNCYTH
jgi:YVTN family beta-propeller protein